MRVGVAEFSSGAHVLGPLTGDTAEANAAISRLSAAAGWTDISDGLATGAQLMADGKRQCSGERCVMLLLTDGQQSAQYGGPEAAIISAAAVKAAGITLFAAGFGTATKDTLDAMASSPASKVSCAVRSRCAVGKGGVRWVGVRWGRVQWVGVQ